MVCQQAADVLQQGRVVPEGCLDMLYLCCSGIYSTQHCRSSYINTSAEAIKS